MLNRLGDKGVNREIATLHWTTDFFENIPDFILKGSLNKQLLILNYIF